MDLGAPKQRVLLAILLVHPNEFLTSDRLIDELWPAPPDTAGNTLQVYVGKLRKALEPDRPKGTTGETLVTRGPGYVLRVDPDQLDAQRFARMYEEGRRKREAGEDAAAAETLASGLELWRGPALVDFTYEPFAQGEIARLEELRIVALEERLEADLALGRHGDLVGELEALIREHPLRERLRAQLMLALYRSGRQAEALAGYQEAHRTLVEQLGIAPGPALRDLEQRILRQDSELELSIEQPLTAASSIEVAPSVAETRKTVTVLVVGRRLPSEVDPETLSHLDERYVETAAVTIERHGGSVESVLGGQVMAVFGMPSVHEDDALRAARAAVELREAILSDRESGDGSASGATVRSGIATGEVVTGRSASGGSSLAGGPVSLAAELEAVAPPGEVLVSEGTRHLLGDAARTEPAHAPDRRAWRLLQIVPRRPPLSGPPDIPIVGREAELGQIRSALDRVARQGSVHLFTILGVAGIGKSRLAQEFASGVAEVATVLAGRCVPYGEGITFWPLREILGRLTATDPLSRLLAGEEKEELIADRVTEAIGLTEAASSLEEIFWAFRKLFEAVARERPLVLLFEDVHWAEPTLLDFIEYLGERAHGASVLVLCLARPELLEERPAWGGGKRNASSLLLERLSDAECGLLIDTLAKGLPKGTRAQVLDTAEGNPLFLEQILAMLAEGGAPAGEVPIPPTIQAVLASRLDRLGPGQRAAIERASVVGKEFWEGAVADLLPVEARPFALRHLEALVDKEFLRPARSLLPGQEAFRFQHVLIQQATYGAIPKHLRATLHERVAAWLEESVGEGTPEYAEIAGYHLEQTYRYRAELGPITDDDRDIARRAAGLLASASQRAFRRGDMPASVNLLGRAVSLLSADDPDRLELLPDLSYALFEVGELERANTVLAEAIERGRACGDRGVEWNATVKRGNVMMYTDPGGMDPESLVHDATTAIDVLDELGDDLGLARAWSLLAESTWPDGKMVEAAEAAERAAHHARRAGSRREQAWALGAHSMALLYGPTPAGEGIGRIEQLLRMAAGDVVLEANLARGLAGFLAMSGRFEEGRAQIAQSCERLYDLGLKWQVGIQELLGGYVELLAENPAAAERHMRTAKESFVAIGDRWFLSTVAVDLPRAVYAQGRYDEVQSLVGAIDEVPVPADREWQIKRRGIRARLLARDGQVEKAEGLSREAVAIAAETDLLWFHGDSLIEFAEVLKLADRPAEAAHAARDALALYERKGNVASAATTRRFLRQLSSD